MLLLNPAIQVLHHHAPEGGLREHKARVNTRAASRQRLFKHNLPTVSDIYLNRRFFSKGQVNEMLWISLLGTFSLKGSHWKKILKIIFGVFHLPRNICLIYKRKRIADKFLEKFPQIPELSPEDGV
jgi:hypothetical protein